jgi:hypothetical protein
MNVTSTEQANGGIKVKQPILQTNTEFGATDNLAGNYVREAQPGPRHVGYGLPCSKCETYYTADQSVCPICKCGERISPTTILASEGQPTEKRKPFPKQFKSQRFSTRLQIDSAASSRCSLGENHQGSHEPTEICRPCYDHLQERADLMEAALHIDLKEAAQIIYDAVWSDASNPSKTYQNAAQALLNELRMRSGITRASLEAIS